MNTSELSEQGISQQMEQIISLKVELAKQRSHLQNYKQLEINYKNVYLKCQIQQKQIITYQKILESFFNRLRNLMFILNLEYNQVVRNNESNTLYKYSLWSKNDIQQNNSSSILSLSKKQSKPMLIKPSIHQPYSSHQQQIQFSLIQQKIKSILKDNQQLCSTLQKYQKSHQNIDSFMKEQKIIVKKFQNNIKEKDRMIEERDMHISQLVNKLSQIKMQNNQQKTYNQLNINKIKALQQDKLNLQYQIRLFQSQTTQEEKVKQIRQKCQGLLTNLHLDDQSYLKNYFLSQNLGIYSPNRNKTSAQWYSDTASRNGKGSSMKNKYQFVFQ